MYFTQKGMLVTIWHRRRSSKLAKNAGGIAVLGLACLALVLPGSAAHARVDWPTSEDSVPIPPAVPPAGEDGSPDLVAPYCEPGTYVYQMTNTTNTFDAKFSTSIINSTGSAKSFKFTATKTGTTEFSVSGSVSAELSTAIFAKIQATINAGVVRSNTTSYGVETSGTVNAHTALYGDYGNWKENVNWKSHYVYSNCNSAQERSGSAAAPYREAWKLWERKN